MPAYVVVEIDIVDPERYEKYKQIAASSIAAYGGRYLVRGGNPETLEGNWDPKRVVILEFSSVDQARSWWNSPEYAEGKMLRQATARSRMIVVQGYA
jgi:uncharacterized protein (DUF1330 family)